MSLSKRPSPLSSSPSIRKFRRNAEPRFQNDRSGLWRAKIYAALFLCFILGGFLGAVVFDPEAVALGAGVDFARAEAQVQLAKFEND